MTLGEGGLPLDHISSFSDSPCENSSLMPQAFPTRVQFGSSTVYKAWEISPHEQHQSLLIKQREGEGRTDCTHERSGHAPVDEWWPSNVVVVILAQNIHYISDNMRTVTPASSGMSTQLLSIFCCEQLQISASPPHALCTP